MVRITNNKMHRIFGPTGVAAGFFLMIAGILLLYQGWGFLLVLIGAFFFLTFNGVLLNFERRIVKPYLCLFGFIKIGKWQKIDDDYIGLAIVPFRRINISYSRSNRQLVDEEHEFRIFLVNRSRQPVLAIKKCKNQQEAETCIEELSMQLHFTVFSIKKNIHPVKKL